MTNEEKRIKIAEACGWNEIEWHQLTNPREARERKLFCRDTQLHKCGWLPDYFSDLNACHEMEKVIKLAQRRDYWNWLYRITEQGRMAEPGWLTTTATAPQRAEAFGKTLNLW